MWLRKTKKYDFTDLDEVEVYKLLLAGKIKAFPKYFFMDKEANKYCNKIIRYLLEDILEWKKDDIPKKIRKDTFRNYKLGGMLNSLYHSSPSEAVMSAYPKKKYKPWNFVNAPNSYWQGEEGKINAINATKWLLEKKLKWNKKDIKKKVSHQVFIDNDLLGMLKKAFHSSIWECIESTYPGEFKPWEIGEHVSNDFWTVEKGKNATKWLIEDKLGWTKDDVEKKLSKRAFIDNDLYGMLQRCFNSSPYTAISLTYPGEYNPWSLQRSPINIWDIEISAMATKWLLETKLKWSDKDIREKLSGVTFKDNGFVVIIEKFTVYEVINKAYPNRYKPWELRATTPFGFWKEDTSIEATKWLVETKLKCSIEEAKYISKRTFMKYGLSGVFDWHKGSVGELISYIYEKKESDL